MEYRCFKLVSGESIIGSLEDEIKEDYLDSKYVEVSDPVLIGMFRYPKRGRIVETHVFTPWIAISVDRKVKIPTRNIITVTGVRDLIVRQYLMYVNNEELIEDYEETGDEEALEDELNDHLNNMVEGEDNEEESETRKDDTRTYH